MTVVMKTVLVNEEKVEFTRKIFWGKVFLVLLLTATLLTGMAHYFLPRMNPY